MTAIDPAVKAAAVATYVAGASIAATALEHGVGATSVQRWVAAAIKANPELVAAREAAHNSAPRVYRGGWTTAPGGIQRPRVNHRAQTRPARLDNQGDTAA